MKKRNLKIVLSRIMACSLAAGMMFGGMSMSAAAASKTFTGHSEEYSTHDITYSLSTTADINGARVYLDLIGDPNDPNSANTAFIDVSFLYDSDENAPHGNDTAATLIVSVPAGYNGPGTVLLGVAMGSQNAVLKKADADGLVFTLPIVYETTEDDIGGESFSSTGYTGYSLIVRYGDGTQIEVVPEEVLPVEVLPVAPVVSAFDRYLDSTAESISKAEAGDEITISRDEGMTALPNSIMHELVAKKNVSLRFEFTYEGKDYVIIIPAGAAIDSEEIGWYGPLYLLAHFGEGSTAAASVEEQTVAAPYTIQKGDTLSKIAAAQGMTLADLLAKNPQIKNPNVIRVGQSINL